MTRAITMIINYHFPHCYDAYHPHEYDHHHEYHRCKCNPPSQGMTVPVMKRPFSEHKKAAK